MNAERSHIRELRRQATMPDVSRHAIQAPRVQAAHQMTLHQAVQPSLAQKASGVRAVKYAVKVLADLTGRAMELSCLVIV